MTDVAPVQAQSAQLAPSQQLAQAVTTAGAALVASDLTALQAAQQVLANANSTADDVTAALGTLPGAVGGAARATRAQALLSAWQAGQQRLLAIALAEMNGMIAAMDGATS
jgi:hypothetical protein